MFCAAHGFLRCAHSMCVAEGAARTRVADTLRSPTMATHPVPEPASVPNALAALTAQIHATECVPGASPATRWSHAHHARDAAKAARIVAGLNTAGYYLISVEVAR